MRPDGFHSHMREANYCTGDRFPIYRTVRRLALILFNCYQVEFSYHTEKKIENKRRANNPPWIRKAR